jgi:hypothetical protein
MMEQQLDRLLSTLESTEERLKKHMDEMLTYVLTHLQQFPAAWPKETPPSPSPLANLPEQQLTKTTATPKTNPSAHPLPKPTNRPGSTITAQNHIPTTMQGPRTHLLSKGGPTPIIGTNTTPKAFKSSHPHHCKPSNPPQTTY